MELLHSGRPAILEHVLEAARAPQALDGRWDERERRALLNLKELPRHRARDGGGMQLGARAIAPVVEHRDGSTAVAALDPVEERVAADGDDVGDAGRFHQRLGYSSSTSSVRSSDALSGSFTLA